MSDSVGPYEVLAHLAPLFMGFSRQEYWSGWPCPAAGDLPDPGTEPAFLKYPALAGGFFFFFFFFYHLCHLGNAMVFGSDLFICLPSGSDSKESA